MSARMRLAAGLASAAIMGAVFGLAPNAEAVPVSPAQSSVSAPSTVTPQINKVTCGSRTDWFRLWTPYHGYPACYANNGTVYYGNRPPDTTWTTYGYCSGNNRGSITYAVPGYAGWVTEKFGSGECDDFTQTWGEAVEVQGFTITGR
ncbi:hypothetical protein [Actinacidiphila paucisporea]|uniref:Uncharacterized protein n=1 Tax=Actinacidiphila paucisporea TaxID=310782 RepID=A0A1M7Q8G1_9ACTN|nr:hypothetical protein [Actinacidiphila paucisporea]SHN26884.1 hypothetical protein SAMN05216499_13065 [Actinacidiphila paucisporea]